MDKMPLTGNDSGRGIFCRKAVKALVLLHLRRFIPCAKTYTPPVEKVVDNVDKQHTLGIKTVDSVDNFVDKLG